MSKEVELNITIGKDGKITVEPKGTEGKECLDLKQRLIKTWAKKNKFMTIKE